MRNSLIYALLFCSLSLYDLAAQEKHNVIVHNKTGYYLMVTPESGAPYFEKVDVVIDLAGGTPTVPSDPDTPDIPDADPIVTAAHEAAADVGNKRDAEIVSAVYRTFADQISAGALTEKNFHKFFKTARKLAEGQLNEDWDDAWKVFDKLTDDAADLSGTLQKIAEGVAMVAEKSVENIVAESREDATGLEVMAIIQAILKLLELFGVLDS